VESKIGNSDARPEATLDGDTLHVTFHLDPWQLTTWWTRVTFLKVTRDIVPAAFANFPNIDKIEITGMAASQDKRGHTGHMLFARIVFTRVNANGIEWDNVHNDDLPQIADSYWQAPAVTRDLGQ
jgi:hypothetical protein